MRLEFGDCVVDRDTREITRRGKPVHIEPKAYRLLELLLDSRPKALSKAELQDALWPGTYVSELALSRLVSILRDALGDGAKKSLFIRTVHSFGYAFCGEATPARASERLPAPPGFCCRVLIGERQIVLAEGENVIGRDPSAAVWIDKASVSRRHACIVVGKSWADIEDLGSRNGTHVDGVRVESVRRLKSGESIRVGGTTIVFRASRGLGTTQSEISSHVSDRGGGKR